MDIVQNTIDKEQPKTSQLTITLWVEKVLDLEIRPGSDREALAEYCAQPQNREVCEQLLASLIEGSESLPQMDKRKPSFVRFGKRSEDLMMEKRKPSFVRFGRK
ncbi:hypothetical protein Q1695_007632 [Nippostrongylus brasiliensis]|nr:hypothetical protein Q1695_007632 [Nippostrongylus brasiliensis]